MEPTFGPAMHADLPDNFILDVHQESLWNSDFEGTARRNAIYNKDSNSNSHNLNFMEVPSQSPIATSNENAQTNQAAGVDNSEAEEVQELPSALNRRRRRYVLLSKSC